MRVFHLLLTVISFHVVALGLGIPVNTPSRLSKRIPAYCSNAPGTIAGTTLNDDPSVGLRRRKSTNTKVWCAQGSETYIIIALTSNLQRLPLPIISFLDSVSADIASRILQAGNNGALPNSQYRCLGLNRHALYVYDENEFGVTWEVLGQAIWAVKDYMLHNQVGPVEFTISDGVRHVGWGFLE
ncbi:hypothetical protein MMC12_005602 [Toensbergia leucococca]|nr:hypothetical protein [Toensbergia leucococca]